MRPIKLVIEGINSFDGAQTLDFEAVGRSNLFCICGNTGSGKSTIFDAIVFALYGRSARGNLVDMVNLSRMTASASFTFREGDDVFRIDRTVKCKFEKDKDGKKTENRVHGGTECVLYKNDVPVANTADDAAKLVDEVIGLDVTEFKNVYLLEQGEYADFLKKSTTKQMETVGKLFKLTRFDKVNKLAREKEKAEQLAADSEAKVIAAYAEKDGDGETENAKSVKNQLTSSRTTLTNSAKELDGVRAALVVLEKARAEHISAEEKNKAVKVQAERLEQAQLRLDDAQRELEGYLNTHTDDDAQKLETIRRREVELAALNALDREYAAAQKELEQKRAALNGKVQAEKNIAAQIQKLKQAAADGYDKLAVAANAFTSAAEKLKRPSDAVKSAVAALSGESGALISAVPDMIYALKAEKTAYDALIAEVTAAKQKRDGLKQSCESALTRIQKLSEEERALIDKKQKADCAEGEAKQALDRATVHSHAAAVRAELAPGDVCPVCGGVYNGGGEKLSDDVNTCKVAHAAAVAAAKSASDELNNVQKLLDKAKDDYDRADKERNDTENKIDELTAAADKTGVEPDIYRALSEAMAGIRAAADGITAINGELSGKEPAAAAAGAETVAAADGVKECENKIAELTKKLGDSLGRTEGDVKALAAQKAELESKVAAQEKRKNELIQSEKMARSAVETIKAGLDEAVRACPVDAPEFDEQAYNNARAREGELVALQAATKANIEHLEEKLRVLTARADEIAKHEAARAAHQKNADRYRTIADMTNKKAMLNYVATEYIEQFTAAASEIWSELSRGKYTMYYDPIGGFMVSDFLNDGKPRKTETLSGGELFLASLSVAIAIARAVGHGNNAFFFLDEGFGTLDEVLIDTVYAALESLSRDCLVGFISHADSLIDRMPSRVEVIEATDTCGSRIEY